MWFWKKKHTCGTCGKKFVKEKGGVVKYPALDENGETNTFEMYICNECVDVMNKSLDVLLSAKKEVINDLEK